MHLYVLTNQNNGKRYVGQTIYPLKVRLAGHRSKASKSIVTRAIFKHGWDKFTVKSCEVNTREELDELEEFMIRELGSHISQHGYNVRWGGNSTGGHKHTPEAKAKVSAALRGRPVSEETRKKISESNKDTRRLRPRTADQCARQAAKMRGRKHSAEHKAAIASGNSGKVFSEERRKKISEANAGKRRTPEMIEAMRQRATGKKASVETMARMSAAQKARYTRTQSLPA